MIVPRHYENVNVLHEKPCRPGLITSGIPADGYSCRETRGFGPVFSF